MADVKWIKIVVDIFDDEKIKLIEEMPDSYLIITIWFKMLCLCGKTGRDGILLLNNRIAYTEEMLATIFRINISSLRFALKTFEQLEMIEVVNGAITIPNWSRHQNLDKIEARRKYDRERIAKKRSEQLLLDECRPIVVRKKNDSRPLEEELELEEEEENILCEPAEPIHGNKPPYLPVFDAWNEIVTELPKLARLTEIRKRAIKARLSEVDNDVEQIISVFKRVQASDFLCGRTDNPWTQCCFDWVMKSSNWTKIIEGNYDNKTSSKPTANKQADRYPVIQGG